MTLPPRCHHHRRHLPNPLPRIPVSPCSAWSKAGEGRGQGGPGPRGGWAGVSALPAGGVPAVMLLHLPEPLLPGWVACGPPWTRTACPHFLVAADSPGAREGGFRPPPEEFISLSPPHEALDYHFGLRRVRASETSSTVTLGTSLPGFLTGLRGTRAS